MDVRDQFQGVWGGDAPKNLGQLRAGALSVSDRIARATVFRFANEFSAMPVPARDGRALQIRDWLNSVLAQPQVDAPSYDGALRAKANVIDARGYGIDDAAYLVNFALHLEYVAGRGAHEGNAEVGTPYEVPESEFRARILATQIPQLVNKAYGEALYVFPRVLEAVNGVAPAPLHRFPAHLIAVPPEYEEAEREYQRALAQNTAAAAAALAARRAATAKKVIAGTMIAGSIAKGLVGGTRRAGNRVGSGIAKGITGGESSEAAWRRQENEYRQKKRDEITNELHNRIVKGRRAGEWW